MALSEEDIRNQYRTVLGREATASEIADFKRFDDSDLQQLSAEDVGRVLRGDTGVQEQALSRYGGMYENHLAQGDQRVLGLAQNQLQGQFAQQGRQISSSAYINAFAQAAANLAADRQQKLAGFYGQGYQNILGQAPQQAKETLGGAIQQKQVSKLLQQQHNLNIEDYYRQKNDYERANKGRTGLLGGILGTIGGITGGLGGSMVGNPLGGAYLGSQFGRAAAGGR